MNVGDPTGQLDQLLLRESEMAIVVLDSRKGKNGSSEGNTNHCCTSNFSITNNIGIDLQKSAKRRSCKAGRTVQKEQTLHDSGRKSESVTGEIIFQSQE